MAADSKCLLSRILFSAWLARLARNDYYKTDLQIARDKPTAVILFGRLRYSAYVVAAEEQMHCVSNCVHSILRGVETRLRHRRKRDSCRNTGVRQ